MENIPDILKELYNNIPVYQSNSDELQTLWKEYIYALEVEFPEVSIGHDGDTVCLGELSPGCLLCKKGVWDCCYITPACNLSCEFCISPFMQHSKIPISAYGKTAEDMIVNYKKVNIKGISFSGGEPFLNFIEIIALFRALKRELPDNYYWLYTNGVLVRQEHIDILADLGINEIRYNTAATGYNDEKILSIIDYSAKKIENITVELPAILKDREILLSAITHYANVGVTYLHLHELMREENTPSQHLKGENFKQFIFKDGHTTDISLDSKLLVSEIIRKIIDSKTIINFNFCSVVNKLRQIRKRRKNMIQLLKKSHEKVVDEEYLETVFIFRNKDIYQFIHPDAWPPVPAKHKNYSGIALKKCAPLSVFNEAPYISAQEL